MFSAFNSENIVAHDVVLVKSKFDSGNLSLFAHKNFGTSSVCIMMFMTSMTGFTVGLDLYAIPILSVHGGGHGGQDGHGVVLIA